MNEGLTKRLWKGIADTDQQQDAADCIEELKAQLAEAKEALVDIISVGGCYGGAAHMQKVDEIARASLAKLEEKV